jgi:hypothetical protein
MVIEVSPLVIILTRLEFKGISKGIKDQIETEKAHINNYKILYRKDMDITPVNTLYTLSAISYRNRKNAKKTQMMSRIIIFSHCVFTVQ